MKAMNSEPSPGSNRRFAWRWPILGIVVFLTVVTAFLLQIASGTCPVP